MSDTNLQWFLEHVPQNWRLSQTRSSKLEIFPNVGAHRTLVIESKGKRFLGRSMRRWKHNNNNNNNKAEYYIDSVRWHGMESFGSWHEIMMSSCEHRFPWKAGTFFDYLSDWSLHTVSYKPIVYKCMSHIITKDWSLTSHDHTSYDSTDIWYDYTLT
jgi:hypothetical protein